MEKVITLEEALKRMKDYILENLMFRRLFVHDCEFPYKSRVIPT